jgi:hypothetical protein
MTLQPSGVEGHRRTGPAPVVVFQEKGSDYDHWGLVSLSSDRLLCGADLGRNAGMSGSGRQAPVGRLDRSPVPKLVCEV